MRYSLRTLLIVLALEPPLAALSANFLTLPLLDSDRVEATQHLVAWIVENRPMPGFDEAYSDPRWLEDTKHFLVICDYLSPEARVSDSSKVERITRKEFDDILKTTGAVNGILIEPTINSTQVIGLKVDCYSGHQSPGFEFEFRRKLWGLRTLKKNWWVPVYL